MSDKLRIMRSPSFGNHFVAAQEIHQGELLLVDVPIALQPIDKDISFLSQQLRCSRRLDKKSKMAYYCYRKRHDIAQNYCIRTSWMGFPVLALYPQFALLNHACNASVLHIELRNAMIVVACKHLYIGEQLYVSYFPGFEAPIKERLTLTASFGFYCNCALCNQYSIMEALTFDESEQLARLMPIQYFPNMIGLASQRMRDAHLSGNLEQRDRMFGIICCQSLEYTLDNAISPQFVAFSNPNQYNLQLYPYIISCARTFGFSTEKMRQIALFYRRLTQYLFSYSALAKTLLEYSLNDHSH